MIGLQSQLQQQIPGIEAHRYLWGSFAKYCRDAQLTPRGTKLVLIGYSGGGMSETYLAQNKYCKNVKIDLLIAYDPSPSWNMQRLGYNVKDALCYCNTMKMWIPPFFMGSRAIGGGQLKGPTVRKIMIRQLHLAVQYNQVLHNRTVWEVKQLIRI